MQLPVGPHFTLSYILVAIANWTVKEIVSYLAWTTSQLRLEYTVLMARVPDNEENQHEYLFILIWSFN